MKLSDWESLYANTVSIAIKRMNKETLSFYSDKIQDWVDALLLLDKLESRLFNKYFIYSNKTLCISYKTWTALCRKFMKVAKKNNKHISAKLISTLWNLSKEYFPKTNHDPAASEYLRLIKPDELEYALTNLIPNKNLKLNWYDKTSKVLTYRGINAIVDNQFGSAHILDDNGKLLSFDLIWDWYYPIDIYLDLEKNWKNNNV